MRAVHLAIRLTVYYLAGAALVFAGVALLPDLQSFLPIGGAEALLSGVTRDPFDPIEIGATSVESLQDSFIWLIVAITGAVLTALPTAWTYMAIRTHSEYDQSLVETIMVLPIAVTSIVIIVNQSLALAFGLAGIVGAVRFRNTLKSAGDALFIFAAIGIGLSAGIGALEIAIIMTIAFNYCFLALWVVDFGAKKGANRYMRRATAKKDSEKGVENALENGNSP